MRVRTPLELGALVRERRRELALTQQELAERAGVSRLWIRWLEQGKPTVELGLTLRAIAALELDVLVSPAEPASATPDVPDINAIIERSKKQR